MRPANRRRAATIGPRNRPSFSPSNTYMFRKTSALSKTYIISMGARSLGLSAGYAT